MGSFSPARLGILAGLLLAALPLAAQEAPMTDRALMVTKPTAREIFLERSYDAPLERVFRALTEPRQVGAWIGGATMPIVACDVDFRAGGAWRMVYERSSGKRLEVRGRYAEVEAPRRWTHSETYDFSPLELRVETTLREEGGRTHLKIALRYPTQQERDDDFPGVAGSAEEAYERLARHLAAED